MTLKTLSSTEKNRFHGLYTLAAVLCLYLLLVCIFTHPLPFKLRKVMVSEIAEISEDTIIPIWYWWYIRSHAGELAADPSRFWKTDLLYSPNGIHIFNTICNPIPVIALYPFVGFPRFPLNVNLFLLLIITLNGLLTWHMLRRLKFSHLAATVGGALVAVNPYYFKMIAGGRQEQAIVWFMTLFIPAALAAVMKGGRKRTLTAVAWLLLTSFSYWFHGLFMMLLLLLMAIVAGFKTSGRFTVLPLKRAATMVLLFLSFCVIPLYPFYSISLNEGNVLGVDAREVITLKLPPKKALSDMSAPSGHEQLGTVGDQPNKILKNPVALFQLILLIPLLFSRKRPVFWLLAGFTFYILSLGPYLSLPFIKATLLLPFAFIYAIVPYGYRLIDTARFSAVTYLLLAVLSAYSFTWLSKQFKLALSRRFILFSILLIITAYLSRMGACEEKIQILPEVPSSIKALKVITNPLVSGTPLTPSGVIDIPLLSNEVWTRAMWYQTVHGRPLLIGPGTGLAFARPNTFNTMLEEQPVLKFLGRFGLEKNLGDSGQDYTVSPEEIKALREMGFRYILYHKKTLEGKLKLSASKRGQQQEDLFWRKLSRRLERSLGITPIVRSDLVDIFDLKSEPATE